MRFDVQLTHHATADLAEIVAFIRERDGEVRAGGVLTQFEQLVR